MAREGGGDCGFLIYLLIYLNKFAYLQLITVFVYRSSPPKRHEEGYLKVQPCKSYNNKYMIALTQITNTEVFAFMTVLVFKLLSCKVLFTNRKDNRNC